ncbi:MAG: hypothetical protein Q4E05_01625 [Pseudoclavibacter sp.]|nr:hypothetical protein [Pseudoclavibacter sp.]
MRGVNLGGWLVSERWMTPSLYEGTRARDEYGLARTPGGPERLRRHREEFLREEDFAWLAAHGVEAVRIPIGFWALDGAGPLAACSERIDWAFEQAARYGLRVLLCLHAAPGSQNGRDHSGRAGPPAWYLRARHRRTTLEVLERLAGRYARHPAWWGLELLNEPLPLLGHGTLRRFCRRAQRRLCPILDGRGLLVYSDAFTPRLSAGMLRGRAGTGAVMDVHWYHFTFWARRVVPLRRYLQRTLPARRRLLRRLSSLGVRTIVGEWSAVVAGPVLQRLPETSREAVTRRHFRAQLTAYADAEAWFYWSYRTEEQGYWNFRWLVEQGWLDDPVVG